ncbi:MAG: hypothetical protein RL456_1329 [Pseudomonadota bacterium]
MPPPITTAEADDALTSLMPNVRTAFAPPAAPPGVRAADALVTMAPAEPRDWAGVHRLIAGTFPLVDPEAVGWWLCGQRPYFQVMRAQGQVMGFMHVQPRPAEQTLWINMIAVDATQRRHGMASRMIDHCERIAARHGFRTLGLRCRDDNAAGLAFYHRHGFTRRGIEPGDAPGVHFHVFEKQVSLDASPRSPVTHDAGWKRRLYRLAYLVWRRALHQTDR